MHLSSDDDFGVIPLRCSTVVLISRVCSLAECFPETRIVLSIRNDYLDITDSSVNFDESQRQRMRKWIDCFMMFRGKILRQPRSSSTDLCFCCCLTTRHASSDSKPAVKNLFFSKSEPPTIWLLELEILCVATRVKHHTCLHANRWFFVGIARIVDKIVRRKIGLQFFKAAMSTRSKTTDNGIGCAHIYCKC